VAEGLSAHESSKNGVNAFAAAHTPQWHELALELDQKTFYGTAVAI
jgi:hypothetical protein